MTPQFDDALRESVPDPRRVRVTHTEKGFFLRKEGGDATIGCADIAALRRAAAILGAVKQERYAVESKPVRGLFGVMVDCSRNAVPKPETLEAFIRIISSLGYNALQLYTEDTFEVEGEPYFGWLRGAYAREELRGLVAAGKRYGVTLIPCIQTLAHLNQIFRWDAYRGVNDTADILLADDDRTYALIDKMLASLKAVFDTPYVNIGMDEAHLLGLGKHLQTHGFEDRTRIFLRHLTKVRALCRKHGFTRPMLWSDMFMRLSFSGNYYDVRTELPDSIVSSVPEDTAVVYWDYYNTERVVYDELFRRHKRIADNVYFACGAWRWSGFAPHNRFSLAVNRTSLAAAAEHGIGDVFVTLWGDNGGEGSLFGTLPVLIDAANRYYGQEEEVGDFLCREIAGMSVEEFLTVDAPNRLDEAFEGITNNSKVYLYNDLLCGIYDATVEDGYGEKYAENAEKLAACAKGPFGYVFETLAAMCRVLSVKCELGKQLRAHYRSGDRAALSADAARIDKVIEETERFYRAFKAQWYRENKPFGFDVQEHRIGGLILRLRSAKETVSDYLAGRSERIPELDAPRLMPDRTEDGKGAHLYHNDVLTNLTVNVM